MSENNPDPENRAESDPILLFAEDICSHMNADHSDALVLYCAAFAGLKVDSAAMVGIDSRGFAILPAGREPSEAVRIPFSYLVSTPNEVRKVLIEMLKEARERNG